MPPKMRMRIMMMIRTWGQFPPGEKILAGNAQSAARRGLYILLALKTTMVIMIIVIIMIIMIIMMIDHDILLATTR